MRKVLTIVLALLVLVGCENTKPIESDGAISFASQYNRSLIDSDADLREQDIKLFGAYTLDGRTARLFDAERLYYNAELPGWDYDNTQYWIAKANYRFCAVYPYNAPCTFNDAEGKVTIANYEGSTGGPDVLYASAKRDLAESYDVSTVPLHFRHACAAVQFNLINASNATLTDVRNIRLVGLHNRGNFSFDTEGTAEWEFDGTVVESYSQAFGGACTLPNGGLPVNLNVKHSLYDGGALLVLPQTIYKTPVTLHLEYIKQGDAEYAIRNIELGWLGGLTPTEWKPGEKYEYDLTITDNTITFEVNVVDWIDHYVDL
jgi:hypothetical protein